MVKKNIWHLPRPYRRAGAPLRHFAAPAQAVDLSHCRPHLAQPHRAGRESARQGGPGGGRRYGPLCGCPRWQRTDRRSAAAPQPPGPPGTRSGTQFEQVIVSNVDYIIPVFAAANPTPKWGMLDRYLASAESLELSALVVITKLDLVTRSRGRARTKNCKPRWTNIAASAIPSC